MLPPPSAAPRTIVAGQPVPGSALGALEDHGDLFESAPGRPGYFAAIGPGVLFLGGRLLVVLPRCYGGRALDDDQLRRACTLTVRTLATYRRRRALQASVEVAASEAELVGVGPAPGTLLEEVEAWLLLWEDLAEHGPLTITSVRASERRPGRVHWQRTLQRGSPLNSPAGEVFQRLIRTRVSPDEMHELTRLQLTTCARVARALGVGWLPEEHDITEEAARGILDRSRHGLFVDRHVRVHDLLRRIHEHRASSAREADLRARGLVARTFHTVWESMLRTALGTTARPRCFDGRYALPPNGKTLEDGLRLKPDLLVETSLEGRAVLLVLDAKDYAPGTWPATADITKQILYRLLLAHPGPSRRWVLSDVGNAFLFPGLTEHVVELRGVHDLAEVLAGAPGRIVGLTVDFEAAAAAYLRDQAVARLSSDVTRLTMAHMDPWPHAGL